ncbi:O-antigen ligase family protein [Methylomonas sp. CM2]|uniref:O-antigen ligase family protein n=1 Tax=Methylomonas sp. CM2 TaxID=3417647 RepID=UPI003CEA4664
MAVQGKFLAVALGLLFGGLLTLLDPAKAVLALVALAMTIAVMRRPLLGLLLFAFFATLIPYTTVQLGIRITVSEALLALTWLGVFWQLTIRRCRWVVGSTERQLIWLMLFTTIPFAVGQLTIQAEGSGLVNWIRWLMNVSTLLLVPILIDDDRKRDKLLLALLLGTLAMLTLSIFYFLKDRNANTFIPVLEKLKYAHPEAVKDIFSANFSRMASPWVHPNLTGGVLVLFLPLAYFYARFQNGWRSLLGWTVALMGAAGLLFSMSRGAIVSLALVLLWLTWLRVPGAGRIIGTATVLVVGLVLFYPPLQERLSTTFSSTNASTEIRMDEYRRFPDAMARYPLGIGFKTDPPPPNTGLLGISNLWLNFIYKTGIPGMLLFVAVTVAWWREIKPRGWLNLLNRERAVWIGSSAGLLSALLTGLFDHYYSFTMVLVALFWMIMALGLHSARRLAIEGDPLLFTGQNRRDTQ